VQSAWDADLSRWLCPALNGTEPDPGAALQQACDRLVGQRTAQLNAFVAAQARSSDHAGVHLAAQTDHEMHNSAVGATSLPGDAAVPRGDAFIPGDENTVTDTQAAVCTVPEDMMTAASFPAAAAASSQPDAKVDLGTQEGSLTLFGPDSQPIPEQQLQCMVQGVRLLVALLRNHHTWQPVCLLHSPLHPPV